ncbi:predicted protein [Sclerotinia sclerotiorum 1980 UF-70]|uniref:Uncharacterized protein n=1 Tax=Sclerotinia sclerotiorum (strain ATCC 18683 / 1980 / Ss-1) TaxID=665079 RepID=A7ERI0_SCLS1|nr:predicted protein [Sclerotinia sclerotiorum 1980 UF-70]EDN92072.1 predicted protein [Sclerotinia sclerotiorum 1980 UF-70]
MSIGMSTGISIDISIGMDMRINIGMSINEKNDTGTSMDVENQSIQSDALSGLKKPNSTGMNAGSRYGVSVWGVGMGYGVSVMDPTTMGGSSVASNMLVDVDEMKKLITAPSGDMIKSLSFCNIGLEVRKIEARVDIIHWLIAHKNRKTQEFLIAILPAK